MYRLRLLHISDAHFRGHELEKKQKLAWRRTLVMGDAWKRNLEILQEDGRRVDLVVFTGDIAWSGNPHEYEQATRFMEELRGTLGVEMKRFFLVPGNHDIDRAVEFDAWRSLRGQLPPADVSDLSRWMAGIETPSAQGFSAELRERVLRRSAAYRAWLGEGLRRPDLLPTPACHQYLGYRSTLRLPGHPFDIHIIGLDSAWLAGDDQDYGKLWLTEDQVMLLATDDEGHTLRGFRLALMHHPLNDLADRDDSYNRLASHVDLLLRGHLHKAGEERISQPALELRQIAAGCIYERDKYPNSCQLIEVTLDEDGGLQRYDIWFRRWSSESGGHWHDDDSLYPNSRGGRFSWAKHPPAPFGTRLHFGVATLFVGREEPLRQMEEALLPASGAPGPTLLTGMPGVGKTYLMHRFVFLNGKKIPGGYYRYSLEPGRNLNGRELLRSLAGHFNLRGASEQLAGVLREWLLNSGALLNIDNVDSEDEARAVEEVLRQLDGCAVVVCGRYQGYAAHPGWVHVPLQPFDVPLALSQLELELPHRTKDAEADLRLVEELGGLPLAIHLAASYLGNKGHTVDTFLSWFKKRRRLNVPLKPGDALEGESTRATLSLALELPLELLASSLQRDLGDEEGRSAFEGLLALGFAPALGVGRSLGAAISALSEESFNHLLSLALDLSVVGEAPQSKSRNQLAWSIHPLIAELLRERTRGDVVIDRMTSWFVPRLSELGPGHELAQGENWEQVNEERAALVAWLPHVPVRDIARVEKAGSVYAWSNGPYAAWIDFCERGLQQMEDPETRSRLLWTLSLVAYQAGELNKAMEAARQKQVLDHQRGDAQCEAWAWGIIADVHQARGDLKEALRIRRQEALPVYERLGISLERSITQGKIADILMAEGQLDEALQLLQQALSALDQLGDKHWRTVTQGKIVDVLLARRQFDKAARLLQQDILPMFESLKNTRLRAINQARLAIAFEARGQLDEALDLIQRQALPDLERLGNTLLWQARILLTLANVLTAKGRTDEALRVLSDKALPYFERLQMRREAEQARELIQRILASQSRGG